MAECGNAGRGNFVQAKRKQNGLLEWSRTRAGSRSPLVASPGRISKWPAGWATLPPRFNRHHVHVNDPATNTP
jgi:hypothetical protein